jgi:hypothetical protein
MPPVRQKFTERYKVFLPAHEETTMKMTLFLAAIAIALPAAADNYVKPYINKDGEYVEGHYRTDPNGSKLDNYSTKGNTNPYTGKKGTVDPYGLDSYTSSRGRSSTYEYKPPSYEYKPYTYDYSNPYSSGGSSTKRRGY